MRILVTGANGQLGRCLQDIAPDYTAAEFIFKDRSELPLDDFEKVNEYVFETQPHAIINAAAYTAVDKAETEMELADGINGYAVGNLAQACAMLGIKLIHISTDYVFAGTAAQPYTEDHQVHPLNAYGASKLLGEQLALMNHPAGSAIVRTSWVYSMHGSNFVKTMLRLMKERDTINVVNDQFGCPTHAMSLAHALVQIAVAEKFEAGVFHFCNEGVISWCDFASAIGEIAKLNCEVKGIPTSAYPTPAKRPGYSALATGKIQEVFGIKMKAWREELVRCLEDLHAG